MKKSVSVVLLATILLQSCIAYQSTSVSVDEAVVWGKHIKVETENGKKRHFYKVAVEDNVPYGWINRASKTPLDSPNISAIYLQDIKATRKKTWIGVSVTIALIGGLILAGLLIIANEFK